MIPPRLYGLAMLWLLPALVWSAKPAVVVLTDIGGDPDDEQSMVRFLLYADHFDVLMIGVTSRLNHGFDVRPEIVRRQLAAYAEVYPNLRTHCADYPDPTFLEAALMVGLGDPRSVGDGFDSEVSDALVRIVDGADRTVHLVVWGGLRELAQALWRVHESRSPEDVAAFCGRIQVHAIGDQDRHRGWILANFPEVRFIANGFAWEPPWGVRELATFRGMYLTGDVSLQDAGWVRAHVHSRGPLGETYQLHGHGTNGMKEGDTPSFLGLIENGLNVPERPDWGGWGGRYRRLRANRYIDAPDFLDGEMNERHSVARWRPAFQNDFMARLEWCVRAVGEVNRPPRVVVNGEAGSAPLRVAVRAGTPVMFDASGSADPDGDRLHYRWYFYDEVSDARGVRLQIAPDGARATVVAPAEVAGRTLHLILEVTDDGVPALTRYRRILLDLP